MRTWRVLQQDQLRELSDVKLQRMQQPPDKPPPHNARVNNEMIAHSAQQDEQPRERHSKETTSWGQ